MSTGQPYEPFPSFVDFASNVSAVELRDFDAAVGRFDVLRKQVEAEARKRAFDTATRWAAVDSGAIEGLYNVDRGFTISVAASEVALENVRLIVSEHVQRAIQDALGGYQFVLDVANLEREPSEQWIRELHAVVCASQGTYTVVTDNGVDERPLMKGAYKELPNSPVNLETGEVHAYAPPIDTPPEMSRLVDELRSEAFLSAHPILQAAYAHYAFVCIHPFADGNGRVSRALASTFLYRAPGIPLVIFADQKPGYIDALESADEGDPSRFVTFVRERAIDTMNMMSIEMRRAPTPDPKARLSRLREVLVSQGGLPHTDVDGLEARVRSAWKEALTRAIARAELASAMAIRVQDGGNVKVQEGFRGAPSSQLVVLTGEVPHPATAKASRAYSVQIPRPGVHESDYVLFARADPICDVYLRDVMPTVSMALEFQFDAIAEDILRQMVDELVTQGESSLRSSGYIE